MLLTRQTSILRRSVAFMATGNASTPMEDFIRSEITLALKPKVFEIYNDSAAHSDHRAMAGSTSKETHFRLNIVSDAFQSKNQPSRHRMVYALLREKLDQPGGIHALQLRTKTPDEEDQAPDKEEKQQRREQG